MVKPRATDRKRSPQKLASRVKRHEAKQTRKSRQRTRWADLSNLFNETDPRFTELRTQAEASLWETVIKAEHRLNQLIRSGFHMLSGGRS